MNQDDGVTVLADPPDHVDFIDRSRLGRLDDHPRELLRRRQGRWLRGLLRSSMIAVTMCGELREAGPSILKPPPNLLGRSRKALIPGFTPKPKTVLAALCQSRFEHRQIRVDDAPPRRSSRAFGKAFGMSKLAHGCSSQAGRTGHRHQRLAREIAAADVFILGHAPSSAIGGTRGVRPRAWKRLGAALS